MICSGVRRRECPAHAPLHKPSRKVLDLARCGIADALATAVVRARTRPGVRERYRSRRDASYPRVVGAPGVASWSKDRIGRIASCSSKPRHLDLAHVLGRRRTRVALLQPISPRTPA